MKVGMMLRKFFIKRFKHFVSILLIPTFSVFFIFIILMYKADERLLQQNAENTLNQVEENIELVINNTLFQQDLMAMNPQFALSLEKILTFTELNYNEYSFMNTMKTILQSFEKSHAYIDSIYLYIDGKEKVFSSDEGVCLLESFMDKNWYNRYKEIDLDKERFIERREVKDEIGKGKELITIYQKMTALNGVIVINVDAEMFQELLQTISYNGREVILVLNEKGNILAEIQNKGIDVPNEEFMHIIENEKDGYVIRNEWYKSDGEKYLINIKVDVNYNIYLISAISHNSLLDLYKHYLFFFFMLFVVEIFIVLYLAYITTKRSFDQIAYIIQVFDDAEKGKLPQKRPHTAEDEYDVIMNNIINMFIHTTFLKNEVMEEKYKKEIAELKALQLQINPHFLLNTLQSINFEAEKRTGEITVVNQMISNLSDILKYSLAAEISFVSVRDELDALKKYVKIQQFRFEDNFIMYYEVDDQCMDVQIPRLLLQPLVENAITHGTRPSLKHTEFIKLKIYKWKGYVYFTVINTGAGISRKRIEEIYRYFTSGKSEGIGLTNVNRRLQLYYGNESKVRIYGKESICTKVFFKIPVK